MVKRLSNNSHAHAVCSFVVICKGGGITHIYPAVEKARYAARDPLKALKKYLIENNVVNDKELKAKCYCFT